MSTCAKWVMAERCLSWTFQMDELIGFVEDTPITRGQTLNTRAILKSGGVYLVGELRRDEKRDTTRGIFRSVQDKATDAGVTQVWARCYRINGPMVEDFGGGGFLGGTTRGTDPLWKS